MNERHGPPAAIYYERYVTARQQKRRRSDTHMVLFRRRSGEHGLGRGEFDND